MSTGVNSAAYEWLEDGTDPQVAAWLATQRSLCEDHLASLPHRSSLREQLAHLHSCDTTTAPVWRGWLQFSARRTDGGKRYVILRSDRRRPAADPVRLFDSTALGQSSQLLVAGWHVSRNAHALAVEFADLGQESVRILLIDTATLNERIVRLEGYVPGSLVWHGDDDLFYIRVAKPQMELCHLQIRGMSSRRVSIEGADAQSRRLSIGVSRNGRSICLLQYAVDGTVTLLAGPSARAAAGCLRPTVSRRGSRILARFSSDDRLFYCTDSDLAAGRVRIHDPSRPDDRTVSIAVPPGEQLRGFIPMPGIGPDDALVTKNGTGTSVHLLLCQAGRATRLTDPDRLCSIGAVTTDPLPCLSVSGETRSK